MKNNDFNLALKNLKKVIRYDNKFIEPYIIMGLIYLKKNLYYSSKKSFEKAIRLDKGNKKVIEYYMIAAGRAIKEKGKYNFYEIVGVNVKKEIYNSDTIIKIEKVLQKLDEY